MSLLASIFCSRVRAAIFSELFGLHSDEMHLRELQRRTGFALGTVRQDIAKLSKQGLIIERRDGNRLYCSANKEHPLYKDIRQMVLKTTRLADILKTALNLPEIDFAFIFGSIANDAATPHSDIDLMVIGDITLRKLTELISGMSNKLGRDINPHVISRSEFFHRLRGKDHFITAVANSDKIFVTGTEHELAAMAE